MTDLHPKDIEHARELFRKTEGKAWEPPALRHPWLVKLIEAGLLRRCDMRCGFEAFKESGVAWTDAGRLLMESLDNQVPDSFDELIELVADNPTSSETEGVPPDDLGDEIIYLARQRRGRAKAAAA